MSLQSLLARNAQRAQSKMRMWRAHRARHANVDLSEQLEVFYRTNPVSPWQREDVAEIRKTYEEKNRDLAVAHDIAASRLSDRYMHLELDYLRASTEFKEKNPGMRWTPSGVSGIFSKAFWNNFATRLKSLGVSLRYGTENKTG